MARTIRLQLSDEAEKIVDKIGKHWGLSDEEIVSKALWILKTVEETGRVALLKSLDASLASELEEVIDYIFTLDASEPPLSFVENANKEITQPVPRKEPARLYTKFKRRIPDPEKASHTQGELNTATESFRQLLETAFELVTENTRTTSDVDDLKGEVLYNMGNVYRDLDQRNRAIEYYEQAVKVARKIGDQKTEVAALHQLGTVYHTQGELNVAIEYYEEVRRIVDKSRGVARLHSLPSEMYREQTEEHENKQD